jgi:hypothetical protein
LSTLLLKAKTGSESRSEGQVDKPREGLGR